MKRKITITYHWKCEALGMEIPDAWRATLEEATSERIQEFLRGGYVAGELACVGIYKHVVGKVTPHDGWFCRGWLDIETTEA